MAVKRSKNELLARQLSNVVMASFEKSSAEATDINALIEAAKEGCKDIKTVLDDDKKEVIDTKTGKPEMKDTGMHSVIDLKKVEAALKSKGVAIPKPEYDLDHAADVIGHAAVKYFDLRQNRINDYAFDYNKILDPQGDTAVYLLYNYARICSIMRKTGADVSKLNIKELTLDHAEERALATELLKFPDMIDRAIDELMINQLCNYLYSVVSQFSGPFYQSCPVAKVDNGKVVGFNTNRVLLCELTRKVLEQGFTLLGFKGLEVM